MADSSECRNFGIGGGGRNCSDKAKCWAENTGFWVTKSSQSTWGGDQSPQTLRWSQVSAAKSLCSLSRSNIHQVRESSTAIRSASIQSSPGALTHNREKSSKLPECLITESRYLSTTAPPALPASQMCLPQMELVQCRSSSSCLQGAAICS